MDYYFSFFELAANLLFPVALVIGIVFILSTFTLFTIQVIGMGIAAIVIVKFICVKCGPKVKKIATRYLDMLNKIYQGL